MARRGPRTLDARERALWAEVVKSAAPIRKPQPLAREDGHLPQPERPPEPERPRIEPFRIGDKARTSAATIGTPQLAHLRMDKRAYTQLRRGKSKPDARIDLHGMTAAAAHTALTGFLMRAHADGKRLVLVITGKGRSGGADDPVPEQRGILRRQVPHWLTLPPLTHVVLQVVEAHQRHGGSGAFYVYLRRR